jgi:RNA polymerase sigma factor (TIGR02999 family)
MLKVSDASVTVLLSRWKAGDQNALEQLMPLVYDELRRVASHMMRHERPGHTLQSTAVVHEAYLRLAAVGDAAFENRQHFFAAASFLVRRILVDHARHGQRLKRGGGEAPVALSEIGDVGSVKSLDLARLDDALKTLRRMDPRQCRVVEMRFFGGMENQEIADTLGISINTVKRDWATARAWLLRELQ